MPALPKTSAEYGQGFADNVIIRGVPLNVAHPGQAFWVDANAGRTGRGTFRAPDTTIDAAVNRCVADRGDIIFIKPGHSENIIAAGGGPALDTAGVALVGLGSGNKQPQLTFATSTAADLNITGDNQTIVNVRFTNNIAACVAMVDVDCDCLSLYGCRFDIGTADAHVLKTITIGAGMTDFTMVGCIANHISPVAADSTYANSFLFLEGTMFGNVILKDNFILGYFAVAPLDLDDDAITAIVQMEGNKIINLDTDPGVCCLVNAATVCINNRNCWGGTKNNTAPFGDDGASFQFEDLGTDQAGTYAIVFGTATAFS